MGDDVGFPVGCFFGFGALNLSFFVDECLVCVVDADKITWDGEADL